MAAYLFNCHFTRVSQKSRQHFPFTIRPDPKPINSSIQISVHVAYVHGSCITFVSSLISFKYLLTALCSDPVGIANGMVTFTGNSVGDTATYTCNLGFELIGSVTIMCTQVNGKSAAFSPAPPVCIRECCINVTRIFGVTVCLLNHTRLRV